MISFCSFVNRYLKYLALIIIEMKIEHKRWVIRRTNKRSNIIGCIVKYDFRIIRYRVSIKVVESAHMFTM